MLGKLLIALERLNCAKSAFIFRIMFLSCCYPKKGKN